MARELGPVVKRSSIIEKNVPNTKKSIESDKFEGLGGAAASSSGMDSQREGPLYVSVERSVEGSLDGMESQREGPLYVSVERSVERSVEGSLDGKDDTENTLIEKMRNEETVIIAGDEENSGSSVGLSVETNGSVGSSGESSNIDGAVAVHAAAVSADQIEYFEPTRGGYIVPFFSR